MMNKISKICCGRSDIDAVEPSRLAQHPNQLVPERTLGQDMRHLRTYAMRGKKHGNGYLISEAHFLPNGNLHDIVISFDGEERTKMMVAIDNKIVSELNIKDELEGTIELYLNDGQYLNDGLVIVFIWDLSLTTKRFKFLTKPLSHKTATDSSSYNNGDNSVPDFNEVEFQGKGYICWLNVYAAE
ncbi:hypothetical protein IEQ34_016866 [Dendrobium chrysotoxum]|uniref:Uncharacterized protein n=1 Tax=Dendrobium chrysotoxum TaxID=161865 RepID=A0AAV7GGG1_DENCH|nr:hypothetical protein IEQ34_016866 [Dendrobium chrysotoxum]